MTKPISQREARRLRWKVRMLEARWARATSRWAQPSGVRLVSGVRTTSNRADGNLEAAVKLGCVLLARFDPTTTDIDIYAEDPRA